jgi:DNA-binding winged helix-turn-helix (wHTH) protein/Tol biopolymer transport system component
MAKPQPQRGPLRFGNFEVDLRAGELRKAGVKLKLGGQPFQILTILLEHPGQVVTREELQKQLWPDTFVDVDHNLNTAINKIREVLGDSAENPRFVETLPRRGYRFLTPVEGNVPPPPEPKPRSTPPNIWLKFGVGIFAIAAIALGAVGVYRWLRPQPHPVQEQAALTPVPFTALAGQATAPAFSSDGFRIAFAWNGDPKGGAKGFDLYVKVIGSETLLRLTQHPSEWISPAWSPDGTQIAFHRMAGPDTGIYLVPALGGPERKLRSTRMPWWWSSQISWSPDGKWIALADVPLGEDEERTYLLSTETLEINQIPISPKCDRQGMPAFSHNGQHLAYWCLGGVNETTGLYSVILPDGEPKMIAELRTNPSGLTWSADDKRIIYSFCPYANEASCEIGEVDVASGSTKRLTLAGSANVPTVSPRGDKLAYSSLSNSSNIWRRDLLRPEVPAVQLMPSSRKQWGAHYSPNGVAARNGRRTETR